MNITLGKGWAKNYEGSHCPTTPPSKTYHVFYGIISKKLPPPLSLEGLFCYCPPRLAWGQAGNPFKWHQTIFHSICLITRKPTWTSQFIKSLATVLSMPTERSTHTERGELRWARRTNILLSSSLFSISVFSSPTPSDGSPLQSRRNPLDKQKKPPGSTFCSPGPGSPQGFGRRACGAASPINLGSGSAEACLWP